MARKFKRSVRINVVVGRMMTLFIALFASSPVHAYIGPGAGLTAIGSVLALVGGVLLLILGFIWYPVKRILKRKKPDPAPAADSAETSELEDSQEQHVSKHTQSDES